MDATQLLAPLDYLVTINLKYEKHAVYKNEGMSSRVSPVSTWSHIKHYTSYKAFI
jgi:hypothetical protein